MSVKEKIQNTKEELDNNKKSILFSIILIVINILTVVGFNFIPFGFNTFTIVVCSSIFGLLVSLVSNIMILKINKKLLDIYNNHI